jgi:hypothetical protein
MIVFFSCKNFEPFYNILQLIQDFIDVNFRQLRNKIAHLINLIGLINPECTDCILIALYIPLYILTL